MQKNNWKLRLLALCTALLIGLMATACSNGPADVSDVDASAAQSEADASAAESTADESATDIPESDAVAPESGSEDVSVEDPTVSAPAGDDSTAGTTKKPAGNNTTTTKKTTSGGSNKDNTDGNTGATTGKLSVMVIDKSKTPASEGTTENNRWTRWIQSEMKKQSIDVSYVMVGIQEQDDVLMAKMAARNAPDIVSTYTLSLFQKYAQQGAIKDITDSLATYGKDILALNKDSDVLAYGKINGRQYAIPNRRYDMDWMVAYIRKDWVDQVGMSLPTTRDELVEVLKAFRDQKPGGAGTIPWANHVRGYEYNTHILDIYSFCENTLEERYCIPVYYRDGYKKDAQWLNTLYKQKLIDQNFETTDHVARFKAGDVGFIIAGWWDPLSEDAGGWMSTLKKKIPTAEIVAVDCFKDKNGKYFKESYASYCYFNMITATCKNPIVAMKYLNFLADPDVILKLNYGEEGTHYKMAGKTPIKLDSQKSATEVDYVGPALSLIAPYDSRKVDLNLSLAPNKWGQIQIQARQVAANDAVEQVTFKEKIIESEVKYYQQQLSVVNTYWNKLLKASDFEATWNQYVNALKKVGIEEVVKERTDYYNKYVKGK